MKPFKKAEIMLILPVEVPLLPGLTGFGLEAS